MKSGSPSTDIPREAGTAAPGRPEVRRRSQPLDWQTVADAAVALADKVGLDRLSLRGVAEQLGVTPMALYKHISDKAELDAIVISRLLDRSLADLEFAPGLHWRAILHAGAMEIHGAFQLHPGLIPVFIQYPFHPKSQRLGGQMIDAMIEAGLDEVDAMKMFAVIAIWVMGHAMTEHHFAKGKTSEGFDRDRLERVPEPAVAPRIGSSAVQSFDDALEFMLDLVAAGIASKT